MDRTRVIRALRAALFTACCTAGVLLIVIWARSYWEADDVCVRVAPMTGLEFVSRRGCFVASYFQNAQPLGRQLTWFVYPSTGFQYFDQNGKQVLAGLGFNTVEWANGRGIIMPHWFLVLILGATAYFSTTRAQFNLRTLILITTIVSLLLAIAAYCRMR